MRKTLCERLKAEILPEFSEPYLSEVAFCRSPADFAKIHIRVDPASRVLCCSRCKVVVHASCYGVLDELDNEASSWKCDACNLGDEEPVEFLFIFLPYKGTLPVSSGYRMVSLESWVIIYSSMWSLRGIF